MGGSRGTMTRSDNAVSQAEADKCLRTKQYHTFFLVIVLEHTFLESLVRLE